MNIPFAILTLVISSAHGQFPSPPTDLTVISSKLDSNVKISYKQTDLCETTPGVKSFSGFVHLPQSSLTDLSFDFDINTYFLFFEARNDPENAPLGIYLAGGPGESSAFAAMNGEGGSCYVNLDANSTTLNPWSLNNYANMLYIDQPVGAGFSYTSLINGTHDAFEGTITPLEDYQGDVPASNKTFGQGKYTNQTPWATTNTSISSAQALWNFAEHWLTQFPEYKSKNKKMGIWGNSAGGIWAPATGALFDKKIKESDPKSTLYEWTVDNVGVTNGVLDFAHDASFYADFAYNNTYGQFIDEDTYLNLAENYVSAGGCRDLAALCRAAGDEGDPLGRGTNATVNGLCKNATTACLGNLLIFPSLNISAFDIAVHFEDDIPGGDPCPYYFPVHTFLNQEWTQKALGVPLNFTYISNTVLSSFSALPGVDAGTGDIVRTSKRNIEYLLQNNIKVALVYGDRDSRCPWNAAEDLALTMNYTGCSDFNRGGYEFIQTNESYQGGVVKQSENLSFSRVFQSGHAVNTYQPETVGQIFSRTFHGEDVATGTKKANGGYLTQGPQSSFNMIHETLPKTPATCMVLGSFQNESIFVPLMEE